MITTSVLQLGCGWVSLNIFGVYKLYNSLEDHEGVSEPRIYCITPAFILKLVAPLILNITLKKAKKNSKAKKLKS